MSDGRSGAAVSRAASTDAGTSSYGEGSTASAQSLVSLPGDAVAAPKPTLLDLPSQFVSKALSPSAAAVRGLSNRPGENNCFLNVVVQMLMHIPELLEAVGKEYERGRHADCPPGACVFCGVMKIMEAAESEGRSQGLRDALNKGGLGSSKGFNLGEMNDAAEVYETLLDRLHANAADDRLPSAEECFEADCFIHRILGVGVARDMECPAHGAHDTERFWSYITYVPASDLYRHPEIGTDRGRVFRMVADPKEAICCRLGEKLPEPVPCEARVPVVDRVTSTPKVCAVGLSWSHRAVQADIDVVVDGFTDTVSLGDIPALRTLPHDRQWGDLIGIVCYYMGSHYVCYGYNEQDRTWLLMDDALITPVGNSYRHAADKMLESKHQPCLLFFRLGAAPPPATPPGETLAARRAARQPIVAPRHSSYQPLRVEAASPVSGASASVSPPAKSPSPRKAASIYHRGSDDDLEDELLKHALRASMEAAQPQQAPPSCSTSRAPPQAAAPPPRPSPQQPSRSGWPSSQRAQPPPPSPLFSKPPAAARDPGSPSWGLGGVVPHAPPPSRAAGQASTFWTSGSAQHLPRAGSVGAPRGAPSTYGAPAAQSPALPSVSAGGARPPHHTHTSYDALRTNNRLYSDRHYERAGATPRTSAYDQRSTAGGRAHYTPASGANAYGNSSRYR
eukprot:TRINITY_DN622_c0_g1_i1.p1 TRINITY_DN622_c0_g1~~TRINITY_DN622_c0_g1_i1.p1  ORF type:complete len:677 (+),score=197.54 TRINITY_DN622_c0_g1_i1:177-2207(+)